MTGCLKRMGRVFHSTVRSLSSFPTSNPLCHLVISSSIGPFIIDRFKHLFHLVRRLQEVCSVNHMREELDLFLAVPQAELGFLGESDREVNWGIT